MKRLALALALALAGCTPAGAATVYGPPGCFPCWMQVPDFLAGFFPQPFPPQRGCGR